jgi:hypothetical protein
MNDPAQLPRAAQEFIRNLVMRCVRAEIDHASARLESKLYMERNGHLELFHDLDDWADTIIRLNVELQHGWRSYNQGVSEAILDEWPAQELFSYAIKEEQVNWLQRWRDAGGQIFDNRMIALKNSEVWIRISDFGYMFPPFAAHSHAWVRGIDRNEAMALGLIDLSRRIVLEKMPAPPPLMLGF